MSSENSSSKKVVKAGAGYIIGNYLLKGITFLSVPIFSRLLTTSEYGEFNAYMSYEAIFYIIIGMALHSSINSAKYQYKDRLDEYVSSITALTVISTIVWFIAANIFYDGYKEYLDLSRVIVNVLIFHCMGSALLQFYNAYVGLNYSYKSFIKISSTNALSNIILSVILILTVLNGDRTVGRIIGTAVPIIGIGIFIIIFFWKKKKPVFKKEYFKFALVYSLPIIPHGISQVILSSFDRIMIKDMTGAANAGIYSFAYTIYSIFMVASNSLQNVWKPWLFEKMNAKEYNQIKKQSTNYALGMALFTGLVIMVSPELVKILGDRAYWNSVGCVVPVVVGGYFAFLYTLPSQVEYYYGKTKYIALGTVCAAGLNIVLNYIFIPRFGYIAAAYTTLFTYIVYFIAHYIMAQKIHKKPVFQAARLCMISVGLLFVGAVTILLEDLWYVRWILEICIGSFSVYWANKQFDFFVKIKKKLGIK